MPEPIKFPLKISAEGLSIAVSNEAHLLSWKKKLARDLQEAQQHRLNEPLNAELLRSIIVNLSFLEKILEIEECLIEEQCQRWFEENEELDRQINELITPILHSEAQSRS